MQGSADSIWSNTVLASYVYELMAKTSTPNTYAGYVEAAQGLSNLIVALPVGWVTERHSNLGGTHRPADRLIPCLTLALCSVRRPTRAARAASSPSVAC